MTTANSILELTIVADENDADYLHSVCNIDETTLGRLKPLLEAIRDFKGDHNWYTSDYRREGDLTPTEMYPSIDAALIQEFDEEYVPYGTYGVHTITTIKVRQIIILKETQYV